MVGRVYGIERAQHAAYARALLGPRKQCKRSWWRDFRVWIARRVLRVEVWGD